MSARSALGVRGVRIGIRDPGPGARAKGTAIRALSPSFPRRRESILSLLDSGFRRNDEGKAKSSINPVGAATLAANASTRNPGPGIRTPLPQSGFATFSLLELIIVIILVAILFIVALEKLLPLRGRAEAAHVQQTLGALRSGVSLRTVELIAEGGLNAVGQLHHSNPMAQLKITPNNYRGAKATVNPAQLPPGSWVFETSSNTLLYKIRYPQYLAIDGPPIIRWQVQVARNPSGSINGVAVTALSDYAWKEPEGSETLSLLGME